MRSKFCSVTGVGEPMNGAGDMLHITADELPKFMQCNGGRNMPPAFPEIKTDEQARIEGTAAHYVALKLFEGSHPDILVNRKAPNGFTITHDMINFARLFLSGLDCGEMEAVTSWDGTNFEVAGRCDHWKYDGITRTLYVDDFKYGHRIVNAEMNWTLISHAVGLIMKHGLQPLQIKLRIHQPRAYHPEGYLREWSIPYHDLADLHGQLCRVLSAPSDTLGTGPACLPCPALATCPAARAVRLNICDMSSHIFSDDLPNDALDYELQLMQRIESIVTTQCDALEELTKHRLKQGAIVGNCALEPQLANTRWKTGLDPVTMTVLTGVDMTKPGLPSIAEARNRGCPEIVIATMTERPLTGVKLIRIDPDARARKLLKQKG